ncbi:hypothetical protein ABKN59_008357 [Abortiporus biennis]
MVSVSSLSHADFGLPKEPSSLTYSKRWFSRTLVYSFHSSRLSLSYQARMYPQWHGYCCYNRRSGSVELS